MTAEHGKYEAQNLKQVTSEHDPFTIERYEQFARYIPRGATTLVDVGCNSGRGGARLKSLREEIQIFGLDCVQERLDALPGCYAKGVYGLSTKIPLDDCSIDVIVAGEFLEHLYPADVDPTLCEFQRVLKVGGRLLMTTPNPNYIKNRLSGGSVYDGISHLTQHFPEVLRNTLKAHGFSRVKLRGSGKVSRWLGEHFPFLPMYGSYLIVADKK